MSHLAVALSGRMSAAVRKQEKEFQKCENLVPWDENDGKDEQDNTTLSQR